MAGIYRWTYGKPRGQSVGLMASLVLLTVLICMVTLVIGNNIARAFSLAGALAIIRFRTVVEETRDTGFVIFAVAEGMAVGAGYWTVALIAIPFAAVAAFLFRPGPTAADDSPAISHSDSPRRHRHSPAERLRERSTNIWNAAPDGNRHRALSALDVTYSVRLLQEEMTLPFVAAAERD